MKTGPEGLALIKSFEQCRLKAFKPTPNDVWTIGWGHTHGVKEGDTCTQDEADSLLMMDLSWAEDAVNENTDGLNQNQFDACVSLCYNIGESAFKSSTLVQLIQAGNISAAAQQFIRWNKQSGQVLAGLTRRREAEAALFET